MLGDINNLDITELYYAVNTHLVRNDIFWLDILQQKHCLIEYVNPYSIVERGTKIASQPSKLEWKRSIFDIYRSEPEIEEIVYISTNFNRKLIMTGGLYGAALIAFIVKRQPFNPIIKPLNNLLLSINNRCKKYLINPILVNFQHC